jgi:hypothetical protein
MPQKKVVQFIDFLMQGEALGIIFRGEDLMSLLKKQRKEN